MLKRSCSFSYTDDRKKSEFVEFFSDLSREYSLVLMRPKKRVFPGVSPEEIVSIYREFSPDEQGELGKKDHPLPPPETVARLAKPVEIQVMSFEGKRPFTRIEVELADSNCYPVFGIFTWTGESNTFVGGFATVECDKLKTLKAIFARFAQYLELPRLHWPRKIYGG